MKDYYTFNETCVGDFAILFIWCENKLYKRIIKNHCILNTIYISDCTYEECEKIFLNI